VGCQVSRDFQRKIGLIWCLVVTEYFIVLFGQRNPLAEGKSSTTLLGFYDFIDKMRQKVPGLERGCALMPSEYYEIEKYSHVHQAYQYEARNRFLVIGLSSRLAQKKLLTKKKASPALTLPAWKHIGCCHQIAWPRTTTLKWNWYSWNYVSGLGAQDETTFLQTDIRAWCL